MTTTIALSSSRKSRSGGFTLAEVLVAVTLSGLVLSIAVGSLLFLTKSTAGLGNYQEMNMNSRFALETFASDARMTVDVVSFGATSVTLKVYNSSGSTDTIVYSFDEVSGLFNRTRNGQTSVLLRDVESVSLSYFTLRRAVATTALEVKEIQLIAEMRRDVLSVRNTNEIISARYMMRNRAVSS